MLEHGLRHVPYLIEAVEDDQTVGLLPLAFVQSRLFGRFLVGLPYLNYGGVIADDELVSRKLIDKAIELAEELDVRHLELRHKRALEHPRLTTRTGHKVHMIRELPTTPEVLFKQLQSNVPQSYYARDRRTDWSWPGAVKNFCRNSTMSSAITCGTSVRLSTVS